MSCGAVVWFGSTGQATVWTAGGNMNGLGYLAGDTQSAAFGVSANGSVVVVP